MDRRALLILSLVTLTGCGVFSPLAGAATAPTRSPAGPTAAPTAPPPLPGPRTVVVANTDGIGVYVRRSPRMDDKLKAWPEGTRLQVVGEARDAGGERWLPVVDPDGNQGWVPIQYVEPVDATPEVPAPATTPAAARSNPSLSPAEQSYVSQVGPQVTALLESTRRTRELIGEAERVPLVVLSSDWRNRALAEASLWAQASQMVPVLRPPLDLQPAHERFSQGLARYQQAAEQFRRGIERGDVELLKQALREGAQGERLLAEANSLLREYGASNQ